MLLNDEHNILFYSYIETKQIFIYSPISISLSLFHQMADTIRSLLINAINSQLVVDKISIIMIYYNIDKIYLKKTLWGPHFSN